MLLKRGFLSLIVLLAAQPGWAGIDETKLIDLTYALDEQTVFWPTNRPFTWEKRPGGGLPMVTGMPQVISPCLNTAHTYRRADSFCGRPAGRGRDPRTEAHRAGLVIDVRSAVEENADYRLSMRDLETWEAWHGPIVQGAVVLMLTGWEKMAGPDPLSWKLTPSDPKTLHFPGFSKEAADFLVKERHVDGIGIDTPSIDYGSSRDFIVHQIINGANLYGLENVANLEKVPSKGAILVALPIKIRGGTGGPVRIIAILP